MAVKIPQDVTREDKLVGPLTLKQFLALLIGGAIIFVAYQYYTLNYLFLYEFVIISFLAGGLTVALAFAKVNGRSFGIFLVNLWQYVFSPKQLVWDKQPRALPKLRIRDARIKDTKTEATERKNGQELKTEIERLAHVLDTGGTISPTAENALGDQILNIGTDKKPYQEPLDVEDVLSDVD